MKRQQKSDDASAPRELRERDVAIRIAAVQEFYTHGYNAVGIRQIAAEARVNSATLYHYYPSKRAILESIMEGSNRLVLESALDALSAAPAPHLRLAYLAGALVAAQITSPRTCYLIDNELRAIERNGAAGQRILELRREYENLWRAEVAAGLARDDFVADGPDVVRLSLLGMFSSASLWYRPNRTVSDRVISLWLVKLGLRLLGGRPLSEHEGAVLTEKLDFAPWACEPPPPVPLAEIPVYAELLIG